MYKYIIMITLIILLDYTDIDLDYAHCINCIRGLLYRFYLVKIV